MAPSRSVASRALKRLQEFLRLEAAGGLLLMAAAVLALVVANSTWGDAYQRLLERRIAVGAGDFVLAKSVIHWVNDGLMAVFFLLVGMELKREVVEGHLSDLRSASLPAIGALGGMLVPAAIYAAINRNDPVALGGWAIPTATDIAFALGVLALLGDRVPAPLKVFLLGVAIFDDLGAILVIAIFYTAKLSGLALGCAAVLVAALWLVRRAGVRRLSVYLLIGVPLWIAVLKSGVHATLAGVVLAMFIPLRAPQTADSGADDDSPLHRLEKGLHPWVAFLILPIFAFANAGVPLRGLSLSDMLHPVPSGIALGLLFGKGLGVLSFAWLGVRLRISTLPEGVRWVHMTGTALLCGIGFTMSLFIASLAFEPDAGFAGLDRLGILTGSLVAGLVGALVLRAAGTRDLRGASPTV